MFVIEGKKGYDFASKCTFFLCCHLKLMYWISTRFFTCGSEWAFFNSPRSSTDRIPPSEGGDTGSIPVEGIIVESSLAMNCFSS